MSRHVDTAIQEARYAARDRRRHWTSDYYAELVSHLVNGKHDPDVCDLCWRADIASAALEGRLDTAEPALRLFP